MNSPKILVCVDFDHTLVDCNTDVRIKSLARGDIPEEIENLSKVKNGWTAYMREVFRFLYKNSVTRDDYIRCLSEISLVDGMKPLLLKMYESGDCEIIIISDANSFFIQCVLHHHQLNGIVSKILTNSAEFDSDGCLQIMEYHNQVSCARCPPNLCKGTILENYVSKRLSEGLQFCRILYIGDGRNDICPALRLGVDDYVFARTGYRLLRALEKMPAKDVKAVVMPWSTGHDIKEVLLSS